MMHPTQSPRILFSILVLLAFCGGTAWAQLPPDWTGVQIGTTGGGASEADGIWTVSGDGHDIWDNADDFVFAYTTLNGDGSIEARLRAPGFTGGTHEWAKAGVMIRESTARESKHAFMALTQNNGAGHFESFQRRETTGGGSGNTDANINSEVYPVWSRLVRSGGSIQGLVSWDGSTWTSIGSVTDTMPANVLIGLAVTSHATGTLVTMNFDNVSINGELVDENKTPEVDAGPDQILILPNDSITLNGTVSDDGVGDPNGYLFYKWSYLSGPGTVQFDPNEFVLNPTVTFSYDPGPYAFELYATDGDKNNTDTVMIALNEAILGDLDGNNRVDVLDLKLFCEEWPDTPGNRADLNSDNRVDLVDYSQLAGNWMSRGPSLVINEFLASNSSTEPPDGQTYDDWIELYNPTDMAINVAGMYLTDNLNDPEKWQFPTNRPSDTIVPSHGFLLIWADEDIGNTSGLHADFQLNGNDGDEIGLYDSDGTLVDSVTFGPQVTDISFGRDPDASLNWYTLNPTHLGSNIGQSVNLVADTKFSIDRGFYDNPIQVEITCATEGATIFYTTNFEDPDDTPSATNFEYLGPITIDKTTCLRAQAFKTGWKSSNTDTHTYFFLNDVVRQGANPPGFPSTWNGWTAEYGMDPDVIGTFDSNGNPTGGDLYGGKYAATIKDDLKSIPTMSLVMEMEDVFGNSGIYANPNGQGIGWERPGSVELIYPDPATAPDDGFQVNCGVRIYGGVGRYAQFEKHTFRFLFKGIYGPTKLHYDLFGNNAADRFDTIIMRAGFNNSWHRHNGYEENNTQLLRDPWMCRSQLDMGQLGLHTTLVHLYVNGLYWGLYNPVERCTGDFGASYLGGNKEEYDAVNSYPRNVVDGTADAWIAAQNIANAGVADQTGYDQLVQYVDIPNLIDYMILNIYAGNIDWDDHNWYAVRHRSEGAGWKFLSWDAERTLESITGTDRSGISQYNKPSFFYSKLKENPEFRVQFGDRVHKHLYNDGALTPPKTYERYLELATYIDRAIVGESARWGDSSRGTPYTRDIEWLAERDRLLDQYFPQRTNVALGFFKNANLYPNIEAPVFNINGSYQHGGYVNVGAALSMVNPNGSGTIYFTFDGADPRYASTTESTITKLVSESAQKKFHVPTVQLLNDWTGGAEPFNDSGWNEIASGNMALDFDGADDYIEINKSASQLGIGGSNPKSITAWAYTRAFNDAGIWDMGSYDTGQNFSLRTMSTTNTWRVQYWGAPDFDFTYDSLNKWVHFALVYDGARSVLYADGAPHASKVGILNTSDVETMKIGRWSFNNNPVVYFDGVIDDVQLYDQALDVTDVQSIMNLGACPKTPVSRWKLDETSGTIAYDSVGTNNGALAGDPTWVSTDPLAGPSGIGYENNPADPVNYADLIHPDGDVQTEMYNTMASCYLRIPFTLNTDPSELNFITLKARYDDGFVAFINGEELTRATFNDPVPAWNDTSDGQHNDSNARELQTFKVTRDMNPAVFNALQTGDNILAVQGLNTSLTSSDFLISVELYAGNEIPTGDVVSPTAVAYVDPNTLIHSVLVKARVLSETSQWSALDEAVYAAGSVAQNLRITELMYHPAGDPNAEFIEVMNIHPTDAINLALVRLTNGVEFEFPPLSLGVGQRAVVVKDLAAFETRYGTGINVVPGQYSGSLSNGGEEIDLEDALGAEIHDFDYNDGWYEITDGLGFSLTIRDPYSTDPNDWDEKDGWRAGFANGGSPGEDDSGFVLDDDAVIINEVLAHSDTEPTDWIEFYNTTVGPIDIGGWFISDDGTDLMKYEIEENYILPSHGYAVFYADPNFGPGSADPGSLSGFALTENGEKVYLTSGSGGALTGVYSTERRFYASEPDVAFGHYVKSTGTDFVAMSSITPGWENAYPKVGPVVINEIAYNPNSNGDAEFVEFLNVSGGSVTLYDAAKSAPWRFVDDWEDDTPGLEYFFPSSPAITLADGEYFLLIKNETAFETVFLGGGDISTLGVQWRLWGGGSLNNGGEQPELQKPGDPGYYIRVDRVKYSDGSHPVGDDPWPTEPDDSDSYTLQRKVATDYGNDVINWNWDPYPLSTPGAANPVP